MTSSKSTSAFLEIPSDAARGLMILRDLLFFWRALFLTPFSCVFSKQVAKLKCWSSLLSAVGSSILKYSICWPSNFCELIFLALMSLTAFFSSFESIECKSPISIFPLSFLFSIAFNLNKKLWSKVLNPVKFFLEILWLLFMYQTALLWLVCFLVLLRFSCVCKPLERLLKICKCPYGLLLSPHCSKQQFNAYRTSVGDAWTILRKCKI